LPEEIVYGKTGFKIKVPMASCTIAAGANEVLQSITAVLESKDLDVEVVPVGCMGLDFIDPWIELSKKGYPSTIYAKVTPDMIEQIILEYLDRDFSSAFAFRFGNDTDEKTVPSLDELDVWKNQVDGFLVNVESLIPNR